MLRIGGTIELGGQSLSQIKKEKDGGVELAFPDTGSCDFFLRFSKENFRRLAEGTIRLMGGKENEVRFKEDDGEVAADDLQIMVYDQAVKFKIANGTEDEVIPTIAIQPFPIKDHLNSGLGISLNEAQAAELVKRLGMFLEAARLHRDASKSKTIAASARMRFVLKK